MKACACPLVYTSRYSSYQDGSCGGSGSASPGVAGALVLVDMVASHNMDVINVRFMLLG